MPGGIFPMSPQYTPSPISSEQARWWKGRPLSQGQNAHRTNTREELTAALRTKANWLEADIRRELSAPHALECRHDEGQEAGDNLTLKEWLAIGVPSGRGLKLDVKEGDALGDILSTVAASGLPSERLMFSLGGGAMSKWGAEIHRRFPDATLEINPSGSVVDGKLTDAQVDGMIRLANKVGQPSTFIVRYDQLSDSAIDRLSAVAPISVWNEPSEAPVHDIGKTTAALRARGVTGLIDLRPPPSPSVVSRVGSWFSDVFT